MPNDWKSFIQQHPGIPYEKGRESSPFLSRRIIHVIIDGISKQLFDRNRFPALQQLARDGASFQNCRTIWPSLTGPAHTAMNSGTFPVANGVKLNSSFNRATGRFEGVNPLKVSRADSVAEIFGRNGFSTAGICGQMNRGLQYFISEAYLGHDAREITGAALNTLRDYAPDYLQVVYFTIDTLEHRYGPESSAVEEACSWVDSEISRLIDAVESADTTFVISADHGQTNCQTHALELDRLISELDAQVESHGRFVLIRDSAQGDYSRLYAELEGLDCVDRIIASSDQSSCFKDAHAVVLREGYSHYRENDVHYEWNHGGVSESEMKVPLIIHGPDIEPGSYAGEASIVDIAPTMCTLFNVDVPDFMQGRVLEEALRSRPNGRERRFK